MSNPTTPKTCGIVMPISAIDGCSEQHWVEVQGILNDSITAAEFEGNLVSNADDVGVIQKRIIQNLYENPMVVCDISCKNPNVMFELGIRLAFDKPTIIVKDDQTSFSFDTAPIEHLEYPRDLRFHKVVEFKRKLAEKIKGTYKKATEDPEYTTFLKHFGEFKVAKIEQKEVPGQELILDELRSMRSSINRLDSSRRSRKVGWTQSASEEIDICVMGSGNDEHIDMAMRHAGIRSSRVERLDPDHFHFIAKANPEFDVERTERDLRSLFRCEPSSIVKKTPKKKERDQDS